MKKFTRAALFAAASLGVVLGLALGADTTKPAVAIGPEQAIHRLVDGNARFIMGAARGAGRDEARRVEVSKGQHPIAAVLSCADSRVPVEVVFDQGLGDIFNVRVAGNVVDVNEMGSLEYAVEHLGVSVVIVMGHTKCGAVAAAAGDGHLPPHIEKLVSHIKPATNELKAQGLTGDALVAAGVRRNVMLGVQKLLSQSEIVRAAVESGKIQVVGEVYDLATGKVEFIGQHPHQKEVIAAAKKAESSEKVVVTAEPVKEAAKGPDTAAQAPDGVAPSSHGAPASHGVTAGQSAPSGHQAAPAPAPAHGAEPAPAIATPHHPGKIDH